MLKSTVENISRPFLLPFKSFKSFKGGHILHVPVLNLDRRKRVTGNIQILRKIGKFITFLYLSTMLKEA